VVKSLSDPSIPITLPKLSKSDWKRAEVEFYPKVGEDSVKPWIMVKLDEDCPHKILWEEVDKSAL
jgi:hypothetical protein